MGLGLDTTYISGTVILVCDVSQQRLERAILSGRLRNAKRVADTVVHVRDDAKLVILCLADSIYWCRVEIVEC